MFVCVCACVCVCVWGGVYVCVRLCLSVCVIWVQAESRFSKKIKDFNVDKLVVGPQRKQLIHLKEKNRFEQYEFNLVQKLNQKSL